MILGNQQQVTIPKKEYLQMRAQIQELKQANANYAQSNLAYKTQNQKLINFNEEIIQLKNNAKYLSSRCLALAKFKINLQINYTDITISKQMYEQMMSNQKTLIQSKNALEEDFAKKKQEYKQKMIHAKQQNDQLRNEGLKLRKNIQLLSQKYEKLKLQKQQLATQNERIQHCYEQSLNQLNQYMSQNL